MNESERRPGRETPPEGEKRPEEAAPAAELAEMRAEAGDKGARAEVSAERRETKERVAETIWEKPRHFVERVIQKNIAPYLRRFLGKFSELDDEAMATDALKKTRDAAGREAGKEE
ncbi:MAG TPA: hypothetical protein VL500_07200 [Candidatus Eisenbacteria bacterium]|jgi:hypothetical protein|nr:hypothetical protein [Candidatus Eisenbacteria bacterium]